MDQLYYESGYIDDKYFVYTAEAKVDIGPYIEGGYIEAGYFDDKSAVFTIEATLDQVIGSLVEAEGSWTTSASMTTTAFRVIEAAAAFDGVLSSSVTANITKNQIAFLDATTTMSTDAVVNRSATITLENAVNISSQADRFAGFNSSQTAATTLTTNSGLALYGQSALTSTTSFYTNKYTGSGRPHDLYISEGDFDTTSPSPVFGSSRFRGVGYLGFNSTERLYNLENSTYAFEFWYLNHTSASTTGNIARVLNSGSSFIGPGVRIQSSKFVLYNDNTTIYTGSTNVTKDQWYHILLLKDANGFSFYVDGTRLYNTASVTAYPNGARIIFGASYAAFDEISFHHSNLGYATTSTSITVPGSARSNNFDTTQFLLHLDGNGLDDLTVIQPMSAALSSQTNVSVNGDYTTTATASINSTASQSTVAVKTVDAVSSQTVGVTVDVSGGRGQSGLSDLAVTTSMTCDAVRTTDVTSNESVSTDIDAVVNATRSAEIDFSGAFTSNMTVEAILRPDVYLESAFTQTTAATTTATGAGALTITANISVDAVKTTEASSAQTVSLSMEINAGRLVGYAAALSTSADQSATVYRTQPGLSDLSADSDLSATVYRTQELAASSAAEFTQSTDAVKSTDIDSALSATVSIAVNNYRTRFFASEQSVNVTVSADAVKTPGISATLSSEVDILAVPVKTVDAVVASTSAFTSNMDADLTARPLVDLETTTSLTAIIGSIKQFEPNETWINYGVNSYSYEKHPRKLMSFDRGTFDQILIEEDGFTLSIWARREEILEDTFQPLVSTQANAFGFTFYNNDFVLRNNTDPDEPNTRWNDVAMDTEWHHYLFYTTRKGVELGTPYYRLWIDGEYKGERSENPYSEALQFSTNQYLTLGSAALKEFTLPYDTQFVGTEGSFAQLWLGDISSSSGNNWNAPVEEFYNLGFVDLGTDGTGVSLPAPLVYDTLEYPWSDLEFQGGYTNDDRAATVALSSAFQSYFRLNGRFIGVYLFGIYLNSIISLTTQVTKQQGLAADLSAESTITADVTRNVGTVSVNEITSEFTQSTAVGIIKVGASDFTSDVTLEASVDAKLAVKFSADLTVAATLTCDVSSFTDAISLIVSSGTLSCDAEVIAPTRGEANLTVTATLTAIIGSIEQFAALEAGEFSLSITPNSNFSARAQLASETTVTAAPNKYTGVVATWSAFNSVLTAGDVINIDPWLTLTIERETRTLTIPSESRTLNIEQETRDLLIKGYI